MLQYRGIIIDILIILITFPYSTCITSVFGGSIPTSLFIFKSSFFLVYVIFVQYSKRTAYRFKTVAANFVYDNSDIEVAYCMLGRET